MRTFLGGFLTSVRERFFDNFTRPDQTGLGTAIDGSSWTPVTSTLSISANSAVSPGNNTNYPMATVDLPTSNVKMELKGTTQGSSAAIWVQSSNDWYLVGQDRTVSYYDYTYSYTATGTSYATGTGYAATGTYAYYQWTFYFN